MLEEWKEIKDWEHYLVSNLGRVKNTRTGDIRQSTQMALIDENRRRKIVSTSYLMRNYWKYEWIKELDDDEEAKPVKGHPNYFITNKGRVFGLFHYKWLKPHNTRKYYYSLVMDGVKHKIHRLVGTHFLPDYVDGKFILHKDETLPFPQINYVSNLFVGTAKDNTQDMMRKERGRTKGINHLTKDQVQEIRKLYKPNVFTIEMVSEKLGISRRQVKGVLYLNYYSIFE